MSTKVRKKFLVTGFVELRRVPPPSRGGTSNQLFRQETKRLHAQAVKRILDPETRELVGWLYQWNTGELSTRWKSKPCKHVVYD